MSSRQVIVEIIEDLNPDYDPDSDVNIVEDGILDSFDIINFIMEVDEELGVTIGVEDIVPENFNTIEDITALVERLLDE